MLVYCLVEFVVFGVIGFEFVLELVKFEGKFELIVDLN